MKLNSTYKFLFVIKSKFSLAGIYIHIPFCKQRCTYCDFHFSTTFESYRQRMIDAMVREINHRAITSPFTAKTLYFGGGTPSLLKKEELAILINAVQTHFGSSYVECTLESNPDDITIEKVAEWKAMGINRLSIGLQSFKKEDLEWMNRAHNTQQSYDSVAIAQNGGIDNITVDLMYGLPALTDEEWRMHVRTVAQMGVQHVSAYCLTIEERTALAQKVSKEEIIPLDEDQQSRQFEILLEELAAFGFEQYEISNFSIPGYESKHNSSYWSGDHYIGIGPSAHSFSGNTRRWNIANNAIYMKNVEQSQVWFEEENLTKIDQFNELVMTGLRTTAGLDMHNLSQLGDLDESFYAKVNAFEQQELIINKDGRLALTIAGRLQADYIASELFKVND